MAHSAATQNRLAGTSGMARIAPAPTVRVALYSRAAISPVRREPSCCPRSNTSRLVSRLAITGSSRTPRALSPAILIPLQIHQATIGGWS